MKRANIIILLMIIVISAEAITLRKSENFAQRRWRQTAGFHGDRLNMSIKPFQGITDI